MSPIRPTSKMLRSTVLKSMMVSLVTLTIPNPWSLNLVRWTLRWMMISKLCVPYSTQEPSLNDDELSQLDALADKVQILRLKGLGVLLPTTTLPSGGVKRLTTRFARTWRDKVLGETRYWLRRSMYVAREFSWLSPDRQDLFSPASSSITNRLLPY